MSIMQAALDQVLAEAQKAGAARVYEIHLRVGTLSGVVPEALEIAFQALGPGVVGEQARLVIHDVPARYWCASCKREFAAERLFAQCPACGVLSRQLRSGREMELASMEVE